MAFISCPSASETLYLVVRAFAAPLLDSNANPS